MNGIRGKEVVIIRQGASKRWYVEGKAVIIQAHPDDVENKVDSYYTRYQVRFASDQWIDWRYVDPYAQAKPQEYCALLNGDAQLIVDSEGEKPPWPNKSWAQPVRWNKDETGDHGWSGKYRPMIENNFQRDFVKERKAELIAINAKHKADREEYIRKEKAKPWDGKPKRFYGQVLCGTWICLKCTKDLANSEAYKRIIFPSQIEAAEHDYTWAIDQECRDVCDRAMEVPTCKDCGTILTYDEEGG